MMRNFGRWNYFRPPLRLAPSNVVWGPYPCVFGHSKPRSRCENLSDLESLSVAGMLCGVPDMPVHSARITL